MVGEPIHLQSRPRGDVARALGAVLLLIVAFGVWGWMRDRERRELSQLPAATREGLYERTMANLTTVCSGPDAQRFESFCREEAALALRLPECDAKCNALARSILVSPTR